jgi:hypothetical protein
MLQELQAGDICGINEQMLMAEEKEADQRAHRLAGVPDDDDDDEAQNVGTRLS